MGLLVKWEQKCILGPCFIKEMQKVMKTEAQLFVSREKMPLLIVFDMFDFLNQIKFTKLSRRRNDGKKKVVFFFKLL